LIYDYLLTYDLMAECAIETVKVLAFSSPLWKRGVGGDFITKTIHLISMGYWIVKSPSTPPFPKGEVKKRILSQSLSLFHPTLLIPYQLFKTKPAEGWLLKLMKQNKAVCQTRAFSRKKTSHEAFPYNIPFLFRFLGLNCHL